MHLAPGARLGRYTLIRKIASGGMAEIWLARLTSIGDFERFVVIKRILGHLASQTTFVKMFLDEARMCAQLNHPGIAQIHDLGQEGGVYYIVMEYVAGENLASIVWRAMKRALPLPLELAARIVADAARALHYAHHLHSAGGAPLSIVHRDVSPQNVLVSFEGEIKVVDFGIAKAATQSELTRDGMLKGKFSYMSPEQCMGAPLDMRSDVFALGIVLYELCTGKRLFKHDSELMILDMITRGTITPPRDVSYEISPELESIVMRALEKDPAARFQTAGEMREALEEYLYVSRAQASTADLSRYMRLLLADKIAEKDSWLKEAIEGTALSLSEEPTDKSPPPEPPRIEMPVIVQSVPAPPQIIEEHRWSPLVLFALIGAVVVIVASVTVIIVNYLQEQNAQVVLRDLQAPSAPTPGRAPAGKVSIDSDPPGATIALEGQTFPNGAKLVTTPGILDGLEYGKKFYVRLTKPGYAAFETVIEMNAASDGSTVRAALQPLPGLLDITVVGPRSNEVRLLIDGDELGRGPHFTQRMPAGKVHLAGRLPGMICEAKPEHVLIPPDATARAEVRCRKEKAGDKPATLTPPPVVQQQAPGMITLATRPYTTVYFKGRKLGQTPLTNERLPSGTVELQFVDEATKLDVKRSLKIEPGRTNIFNIDLLADPK